ncbi:uncharacterized protein LOC105391483 isoform X1 [Plutella xylostella]|uniref:uncharacterized protein LOC105391483 isoform X1 n=1 Tax=Plutella xylostella TaxID=51655 RepID=UPI0005D0D28C|nr:uncharacterized protein LOC105391483 isoform X1 [Plutella xylostella]
MPVNTSQTHLLVAVTTQPMRGFNTEQAEQLKKEMQNRVFEQILAPAVSPEPAFAPMFRGTTHLSEGFIKMWCEDEATLGWLKQTVATLSSPIPDTKLVVVRQLEISNKARIGLLIEAADGESAE